MNWDPLQFSHGLVSHGEVSIFGSTVTSYEQLAADAKAKAQRDEADAAAAARLAEVDQQLAELTRHRDEAHAALSQLHQAVRMA